MSKPYHHKRRITTDILPEDKCFKGVEEERYCSRFGCGKKLTLQEKLFGSTCITCFKNKERKPFK